MALSTSRTSGTNTVPEKPVIKERPRGSGGIYLRGTTWWIRFHRRGKCIRESSGSTDPAVAKKKLDRRMKEVWAEKQGLQAFAPRAEKVYVDELLDELEKNYKLSGGRALSQFRSHMKPIREFFGDRRAVDVSPALIDEYIDDRIAGSKKEGIRPRAAATINRETQLLGQAFALGIERRVIVSAPHVRHLPERNVRSGFFERAEFESVVSHLPRYLQDFARFAYITAWRKGQLATLGWADVDRSAGVIVARAENVKNGRPHKIVIEGELAEIIERRWTARQYETTDKQTAIAAHVFHLEGAQVGDFRKAWASACRAAGLVKPKLDPNGNPVTETVDGEERPVMVPSRIFHDLRRSGVRNMVRAGVREGVAMAISGHRTRAVFDRYNLSLIHI